MKMDWDNIDEDRMLLDIGLNEFEFIQAAIKEKANSLLSNLDVLLHYRLNELKEKPTLKDNNHEIAEINEIFDREFVKYKNQEPKAPYGYKQDGTPKKKPGRKA